MKWILWVLAIALVLIGLDFLVGEPDDKQPMSQDPLASSIYQDGLQDVDAL